MTFKTLISAQALAEQLNNCNWVLFDCRFSLTDDEAGEKTYRQAHITGARYAHLNRDLSTPIKSYTGRHPLPNFTSLAKQLGLWGVNNRSQVIAYDDAGGAFAGRLWWLLRSMGHEQVAVLDGGIQQWQKLGLPLTTALPKITPSQFRGYLDSSQWLSARQVEDSLATRSITLIDARTPERFQGLREPIDRVAGHVPKALNRPFQLNLTKDGLFLPAGELQAQFNRLTQSRPAEQVVHMCGSGVTGCHNLLAMEVAGLSGSKLYAGSWSEWIINRNRVVSTT
jgi:thiosulfate/3-mercaptopyruvate sulfurtransferase